MTELLAVLAGYLLGSLPFGYWLPLLLRGEDIRASGSGNVGATNVARVYGRRLGIAVALLDGTKGLAAALLGLWAGDALVGVLAGAASMVGHARPVFLRFQKGGKMVATAGGVALAVAPLAMLASAAVWGAVLLASRYASLASIAAALALVAFTALFGSPWPVVGFAALGAASIVLLHRHNVARLVRGTEHRFELRRPRRA
jgi:acyl phosphate:glycerol-3-phosphate acyltransferase